MGLWHTLATHTKKSGHCVHNSHLMPAALVRQLMRTMGVLPMCSSIVFKMGGSLLREWKNARVRSHRSAKELCVCTQAELWEYRGVGDNRRAQLEISMPDAKTI